MKLNIVQGLYIVLKHKHKFKKNSSFPLGKGSSHKILSQPTLYHNYILRIYLKNYSIITPTL